MVWLKDFYVRYLSWSRLLFQQEFRQIQIPNACSVKVEVCHFLTNSYQKSRRYQNPSRIPMEIPVRQKNNKLLHHEVLHIQPILFIHFQSPFSCICKKVVPKELVLWQCYRTILVVPLWKKGGKIINKCAIYVLGSSWIWTWRILKICFDFFNCACLKKTITNIRN